MKKFVSIFILVCFLVTGQVGNCPVYAQEFRLPAVGVRVGLSLQFNPPILKGIKVHPDNPFRFDFILDKGDSGLNSDQLKDESSKLIKYFLASLTTPEKDLWVNLSPYEKDRIIPHSFGLTEMGRDLLAEDYMLKQITASLIYPEDEIGKKFWKRIYAEAVKKFGTTNVPVSTFNKVWIIPGKAVVYENARAGTAYVIESGLKVMLEQDYLALSRHVIPTTRLPAGINNKSGINALGSQVVREIIIPELTKEINTGKNFTQLRQVYNSLILATWYKNKIKDSILNQIYTDKNKVAGVNISDPQEKQKIYERYLQAFKKGAYNYIKEDIDPLTQETIPRKYFSGGYAGAPQINYAMASDPRVLKVFKDSADSAVIVETDLENSGTADHAGRLQDAAMSVEEKFFKMLDTISTLFQEGKYEEAKKTLIGILKWFDDNDFHVLADLIKEEGLRSAQRQLSTLDETYGSKLRAIEEGKSYKPRLEAMRNELIGSIETKRTEIRKIQDRRDELLSILSLEVQKWKVRLATLQEQRERYSLRYRGLKEKAVGSLLKLSEEKFQRGLDEIDRQIASLQGEMKEKGREKVKVDELLARTEKSLEEGAKVEEKVAVLRELSNWLDKQLAGWTARAVPVDQLISRERVIKEINNSLATDRESLWRGVIGYLMKDYDLEEDQQQGLVQYLATLGFSTPDEMEKVRLFKSSLRSLDIELVRHLIEQAPPTVEDADLREYVVGKILNSMGIEDDQITDDQRQKVQERLVEFYTGFAAVDGFINKRKMYHLSLIDLRREMRQRINDELRQFGYEEAIKSTDSLVILIKNPIFRRIFRGAGIINSVNLLAQADSEQNSRNRLAMFVGYAVFVLDLEPYILKIDPTFFSKAMISAKSIKAEYKLWDILMHVVYILGMKQGDFEDSKYHLSVALREYKEIDLNAAANLIDEGRLFLAKKELDRIIEQNLIKVVEIGHTTSQELQDEIILKQIELMDIVEQMIRVLKYNDHRELAVAKGTEFGKIVEEDVIDEEAVLKVLQPEVEAVIVELTEQITGKEEKMRALMADKNKLLSRVANLSTELEASLKGQDEVSKKRAMLLRSSLGMAEDRLGREIETLKREIDVLVNEKKGLSDQLAADQKDLKENQEALAQVKGPLSAQIRIKTEVVQKALARIKWQLDNWEAGKEEADVPAQLPQGSYTSIILQPFSFEVVQAFIRKEADRIHESGENVDDKDFVSRIVRRLELLTRASQEGIKEHLQALNIDVNQERRIADANRAEGKAAISKQMTGPLIVKQGKEELRVVALKNRGNSIDDQLFGNDGALKREIVKKMRDVFSNPQAAERKRKKTIFSGTYDLGITTSLGQFALFVKWYKDQKILAIVGYKAEKALHTGFAGYPPAFRDHLKSFTDNNTFSEDMFEPVHVNKAMLAPENTGGIDLTSGNVIEEAGNGNGIRFHLDPAMLAQFQNTSGFVPVIIRIKPLANLKMFLDV